MKKGQNGDIRYGTARHNVTSYGATVATHRKNIPMFVYANINLL